eukprot:7014570-Lingulodinium_polyedra.AAC.1
MGVGCCSEAHRLQGRPRDTEPTPLQALLVPEELPGLEERHHEGSAGHGSIPLCNALHCLAGGHLAAVE